MHPQLCNLEQTTLKVFHYGQLIEIKRLSRGGRTWIGEFHRLLRSTLRCRLQRDSSELIQ
jgi:hypothetical protein